MLTRSGEGSDGVIQLWRLLEAAGIRHMSEPSNNDSHMIICQGQEPEIRDWRTRGYGYATRFRARKKLRLRVVAMKGGTLQHW